MGGEFGLDGQAAQGVSAELEGVCAGDGVERSAIVPAVVEEVGEAAGDGVRTEVGGAGLGGMGVVVGITAGDAGLAG
ncbi:hypothetical protein BJP25_09015 [Actinokineospora bangkokensis]|uniref:Uncharacterized protein n=1 Tax=Actinokineospora bangkokensis TaxID=1193682 RepID=A0A1Q9LSR1_9PSEU|nr:hypothetical protein BJP25_09015 [Actinokineospora bangkokensis]